MAKYLIVASRDLQEYNGSQFIFNVTSQLRKKNNDVTFYLVENGVFAARKGARLNNALQGLSREGAKVLAEDLSLTARGITQLAEGVAKSNMEELATLVADTSDKIIWY